MSPQSESIDWSTYFHELTQVRSMAMDTAREIAAIRSRQDAIDIRQKDLAESIRQMSQTVDRFREILDGDLRNLSERVAVARLETERDRSKMFLAVLTAAGGALGSLAILLTQYVLTL